MLLKNKLVPTFKLDMAYVLIFVALGTLAVSLYYYLVTKKQYWSNKGVVSPKSDIFLGNFKDVILRRTTAQELSEEIYRDHPKEKFVGLYRFSAPILLIKDLDLIQHILVRDFDSLVNRGLDLKKGLGRNLAGAGGDDWKLLRTRFTPIFTSGKLKNMLYLIERCGDQLLDYLEPITKTQQDWVIYNVVQRFTVGSISACAFGMDIDMADPDDALIKLNKMMFKNVFAFELEFLVPSLIKFFSNQLFPAEITNYFYNLVANIKRQRNGKPSGRKDFMDLLLEMKEAGELRGSQRYHSEKDQVLEITDEVIAAQAFIFYGAGYETTASTVSYLLHELAKNQEIQDRVVKEIDEVLKKNNGELTFDSLKEMTYMEQVFDETLRMYPIVDLQRKVTASKYTIPGTDVTIRKDDYVYMSTRGIHYDEQYYPEPHKFDPERFSPANSKSRHPCAYMPFGMGPRNCIGTRFAKIQSRVFLIKFLPRYRVGPSAATKISFSYDPMSVTLSDKEGVPLRIVRRS